MELSQKAKDYIFTEGEYTGKRPSEMLNHYLLIQYMHYLTNSSWVSEENKIVYKELIDYARKNYEWVSYIVDGRKQEEKIESNK